MDKKYAAKMVAFTVEQCAVTEEVCTLASKLVGFLQNENVDFSTGMAALSMAVSQSAKTWGVSEADAIETVKRCIHIVYTTNEGSRLQ